MLKCVITNIVEKPPFVTWYLNNKVGGKPIVLKQRGCAGEMITNDFYRNLVWINFNFKETKLGQMLSRYFLSTLQYW